MAMATETATSRETSPLLGRLAALSVVAIWAAWLVSTRHGTVSSLKAVDLSLLRYGIPALVLAPVWLRTGLWPRKTPKWPLVLMILGSGAPFFQIVAIGMRATPASAAGVLLPGVMPLATALIGVAVYRERPDLMRWFGMGAIALGGMVMLAVGAGDVELGWKSYLILPFCAALWAVFTHAFRRSGLTALEGGALVCVWSTLITLTLIPFLGLSLFSAPLGEVALQVLTQGVLSGLCATLLYGYAIRALGGTLAAAYTAATPAAAAIGGGLLLGEQIGPATIAAAVITGLGVVLSTGLLSKRQA
ncbi:DMT family transporter [Rhizobium sp. FKL33]|uniref:DMT family transporter n=1 Tax=Rhizobium sp. FKL33 TaxID=2562307 RepID=UPI0010BF7BEB|nr:DMT family transporter [Rhizobium sp. FKL33]